MTLQSLVDVPGAFDLGINARMPVAVLHGRKQRFLGSLLAYSQRIKYFRTALT